MIMYPRPKQALSPLSPPIPLFFNPFCLFFQNKKMRYIQFQAIPAAAAAAAGAEEEMPPFSSYYSPDTMVSPCEFTLDDDELILVIMNNTNDLVHHFLACCQTVSHQEPRQLCLAVWNRCEAPVHVAQGALLTDLLHRRGVENRLVLTYTDEIVDAEEGFHEIKADDTTSSGGGTAAELPSPAAAAAEAEEEIMQQEETPHPRPWTSRIRRWVDGNKSMSSSDPPQQQQQQQQCSHEDLS